MSRVLYDQHVLCHAHVFWVCGWGAGSAVKRLYYLIRVCSVSAVNWQTARLIPNQRGGPPLRCHSPLLHSHYFMSFSAGLNNDDWNFILTAECVVSAGCTPVQHSSSVCSHNSSLCVLLMAQCGCNSSSILPHLSSCKSEALFSAHNQLHHSNVIEPDVLSSIRLPLCWLLDLWMHALKKENVNYLAYSLLLMAQYGYKQDLYVLGSTVQGAVSHVKLTDLQ